MADEISTVETEPVVIDPDPDRVRFMRLFALIATAVIAAFVMFKLDTLIDTLSSSGWCTKVTNVEQTQQRIQEQQADQAVTEDSSGHTDEELRRVATQAAAQAAARTAEVVQQAQPQQPIEISPGFTRLDSLNACKDMMAIQIRSLAGLAYVFAVSLVLCILVVFVVMIGKARISGEAWWKTGFKALLTSDKAAEEAVEDVKRSKVQKA